MIKHRTIWQNSLEEEFYNKEEVVESEKRYILLDYLNKKKKSKHKGRSSMGIIAETILNNHADFIEFLNKIIKLDNINDLNSLGSELNFYAEGERGLK